MTVIATINPIVIAQLPRLIIACVAVIALWPVIAVARIDAVIIVAIIILPLGKLLGAASVVLAVCAIIAACFTEILAILTFSASRWLGAYGGRYGC